MPVRKIDDDLFHVHEKASFVLKEVILEEDKKRQGGGELIDVESARFGPRFISDTTGAVREKSRLLIVTNNLNILDRSSSDFSFYYNLASQFDELHIIVAASLRQNKKMAKRYGDNLWIYTTAHLNWFRAPQAVRKVAKEQLTFAEGFRPDFVIATNPFESGLGAYLLARKYDRPFQLQIRDVFWTDEFKAKNKINRWRQKIARWLLDRAISVRVTTTAILEHIKDTYPEITDVDQLPRYYNIEQIIASTATDDKTDVFSRFSLVFLFVGHLDHKSTLFRTIDSVRNSLQLPRTVLVVVGEGPAKKEFEERAKIFGVADKIIFKPESTDVVPLMKNADVFICTDTSTESDDVVIKAAAAGSALLIAKTELREDIFTHDEDAYLCDEEDTTAFMSGVYKMANSTAYRKKLASAAQYTVKTRLHEDPVHFYSTYRNNLERVFNVFFDTFRKEDIAAGKDPDQIEETIVTDEETQTQTEEVQPELPAETAKEGTQPQPEVTDVQPQLEVVNR